MFEQHDFDFCAATCRIRASKIAGPELLAAEEAALAGKLSWPSLMGEVQKHVSLVNSAALKGHPVDSDDWRAIAAALKAIPR